MSLVRSSVKQCNHIPQLGDEEEVGFSSQGSPITLKGIYPEFQVIRGFSQKIPAGLLSYDKIHS